MLLYVGVVALCALPWAVQAYSQPPTVAGESRQDQKSGAGNATKSDKGVPGPQDKAATTPSPARAEKAKPEALNPVTGYEKTQAGDHRHENGGYDWNKLATITNAISTLAIAFFTFFLVRFTRRQADATEKSAAAAKQSVEAMQASTAVADAALAHAKVTASAQLEETRRANSLTLRAWVLVEGVVELLDLRAKWPAPIARLQVRNYGKLPAMKWVGKHKFTPHRPMYSRIVLQPPVINPSPRRVGGIVIPAGGLHPWNLNLHNDEVTPEQLDGIERGEWFLYLTVTFTYVDAMGTGDTTDTGKSSYCWLYRYAKDGSPAYFEETPMSSFNVI